MRTLEHMLSAMPTLAVVCSLSWVLLDSAPESSPLTFSQTRHTSRQDMHLAIEADISGLDPHIHSDAISVAAMRLLHEPLYEWNHHGDLVPRAASALPTIASDGMTLDVPLKALVFENNIPFESKHVVDSFTRILSPGTASPGRAYYSALESVEALSPRQVRFILKRPDASFVDALTMLFSAPVLEKPNHPPLGLGHYRVRAQEHGVMLQLEHKSTKATITFEFGVERQQAFYRFLRGDLSMMDRFTQKHFNMIQASSSLKPLMHEKSSAETWGIVFNTQMPPFDNVHFRKGFSASIRRSEWVRVKQHRIHENGTPLPPALRSSESHAAWIRNLMPQSYHRSTALTEFQMAGLPITDSPSGKPIVKAHPEIEILFYPNETSRTYADLLLADLLDVGIRPGIRFVPYAQFLKDSATPNRVQAIFYGWGLDHMSIQNALMPMQKSAQGSVNRSFYSNALLESLLSKSTPSSSTSQNELLSAVQSIIDDAPWAFVFSPRSFELWQPEFTPVPHPLYDLFVREMMNAP